VGQHALVAGPLAGGRVAQRAQQVDNGAPASDAKGGNHHGSESGQ
jgi:hypothetical protein